MNKNLQHEIQDRNAVPQTRALVSQRDLSFCRSSTGPGSLCTFFWPERMERWEGCEEGSHYRKKSDTAGNKIWLAGWMEGRWVERECFNCKWNFNWKREAKSRAWQDGKNHQWQSLTFQLWCCCFVVFFFIFNLWNHSTKNFALRLISTRPGLCC